MRDKKTLEDQGSATPQVSKFDAARQNTIFKNILDTVEETSCEQSASRPEIRLLRPREFVQTVTNIFQIEDTTLVSASLPVATVILGFDHLRQFNIFSPEKLVAFKDASQKVANLALTSVYPAIESCSLGSSEACVRSWLETNLPILWRQQVSQTRLDAEVGRFVEGGADGTSFTLLVERLLLSPYFLYRRNFGADGNPSGWDVISTISDAIWGGQLSQELLSQLSNADLKSPERMATVLQQSFSDERFYDGLKHFTNSWLGMGAINSTTVVTADEVTLEPEAISQLSNEVADFFYYLYQTDSDSLDGIFSSNYTIGTAETADIFALTPLTDEALAPNFDGRQKLNFGDNRQGLLSFPSVALVSTASSETNPAGRGQYILNKFLCHHLATPENLDVIVSTVKFDVNLSVADALDQATSSPGCAGCHSFINGIGAGMEDLAANGLLQSIDGHGKPVTAEGELISISGQKTPFTGINGLNNSLRTSKDFQVCAVVQGFRMIYGRLEEKRDVCTIANAYKKATQGGFRLHKVFSSLVTSKVKQ